jgi:hypothetical protein
MKREPPGRLISGIEMHTGARYGHGRTYGGRIAGVVPFDLRKVQLTR